MWIFYLLVYVGGFLSSFLLLFFAGWYAFNHPQAMTPIARRMVQASMRSTGKKK